ncbi:MAG: efflux RND transporter periplasmic adaptor subunit [Psychromonas sp.]|nr:efflux RND transporter periplasmic adaptor subunit [Psychromonas sp.]
MKLSKPLLGSILFSILALLFLYMAGVFTAKLPEHNIERQAATQHLQTQLLEETLVTIQREFSATVVADQKAILAARLTAKIAEVLVDVGAQVKKGDILVRLESNDLDARVNQTEQALSSAQAQLNVARKEFIRAQALIAKKLIPQSQFDKAESQLKTANANFEQAKATVSEAETTYGFSVITAPFDGVIDTRAINVGDTATPGMHLLSLYNPTTLQLEVNVSESLLNRASLGTVLNYQIPSFNIYGKGGVVEVAPATDSSSRSFLLKVALQQTKQLFPGNYARVWVDSEVVKQLIIPSEALYQVGQLDYVKVLEADVIKTKLVQLADNYQVRKGVKSGEIVIINPLALK